MMETLHTGIKTSRAGIKSTSVFLDLTGAEPVGTVATKCNSLLEAKQTYLLCCIICLPGISENGGLYS